VSGFDKNDTNELLGVPYDASFDLSSLNLTDQGFQATVQVWKSSTSSYQTITQAVGTTDVLAHGQGFFVERTTPGAGETSLVFDDAGITTGGIPVFYDPDRRPVRETATLRTTLKFAAQKTLRHWEDEVAEGHWDPWSSGPLGKPISPRELVESYIGAKPGLRPKTRVAYQSVCRQLEGRLAPGVTRDLVSVADLRAFIYDLTVSASTHQHRYRHLRAGRTRF
jgi:hypothetical protein